MTPGCVESQLHGRGIGGQSNLQILNRLRRCSYRLKWRLIAKETVRIWTFFTVSNGGHDKVQEAADETRRR
jgi:hypothetical protein